MRSILNCPNSEYRVATHPHLSTLNSITRKSKLKCSSQIKFVVSLSPRSDCVFCVPRCTASDLIFWQRRSCVWKAFNIQWSAREHMCARLSTVVCAMCVHIVNPAFARILNYHSNFMENNFVFPRNRILVWIWSEIDWDFICVASSPAMRWHIHLRCIVRFVFIFGNKLNLHTACGAVREIRGVAMGRGIFCVGKRLTIVIEWFFSRTSSDFDLVICPFSDAHSCKELHTRSHKYALQNFQQVVSTEEFLLLPFSEVSENAICMESKSLTSIRHYGDGPVSGACIPRLFCRQTDYTNR